MKRRIIAAVILLGCTFASCKKNNAISGEPAALTGKQPAVTAASACQGNPIKICACPAVYRPVCGCDGVTYGNSCEARCAGILIYTNGPCGGGWEEL